MVSKYDRARYEDHVKRTKRSQSILTSDLNETIRRTMDSCQIDSESWVARYAQRENISLSDARRVAHTSDINALGRRAEYYVKNRSDKAIAFSPQANREMLDYNYSMRMNRMDLLQEQLKLSLYGMADELSVKTGDFLMSEAIEEMRRQAGILGETIPSAQRLRSQAETIVSASFHDTDFSYKIWDNMEALRGNLNEGLRRSLMMGQHPTKWMSSMRDLFTEQFFGTHDRGGMDYAMKRIAVTETARVQVASQMTSYRTAGYTHLEIITEASACEEICLPLDGKVKEIQTAMMGEDVPPFHPNCRCGTGVLSHRKV